MDKAIANRISSLIDQHAWLCSPRAPTAPKFGHLSDAIAWVLDDLEDRYPAEYAEAERLVEYRASRRTQHDGGARG